MTTAALKPAALLAATGEMLSFLARRGGASAAAPSRPQAPPDAQAAPPPPEPSPGQEEAALSEARALLQAGRAEAALGLLRALPDRGASRAQSVALAIAAAQLDPEFRDLVARADQARDERDWARAEYLYWQALRLYPLHAGYTVQYGHCLKEQGKLEDAEVAYRSALALGAPEEDVRQHVLYVHAAQGLGEARFPAAPAAGGQPLDIPPCRADVEALFALLLQRKPRSLSEILELMRGAATCREVAAHLVRHAEFPAANRDLMVLLAQPARGPA
ncbi:tetratricopeptide repeat protein [Crenalkalicoccus roseus]|uniref:hypothetical protein n=1 Tax=Crenalkalicoccus roseus TaxID=1485588 RepID=UPI00107FE82B|nr:hypothetical protein [Crenalkalicoccus roseus]